MKTNPMTREPADGEVVWLLMPAVMTSDGVWNLEAPAASNRWVDSADGWVRIPRDRFEVTWSGDECSITKADGSKLNAEDARRAVEMLNLGKVRA
jgi:hypothetical protein